MSALDDFLGLSDVTEIKKEITVNINGKELSMVVRAITEDEHSELQKRCQNISKNKVSFDSKKYSELLLSTCIVEPDFNDSEFLKKVKCETAREFINKKFPAGVITDISSKIQKLSGFEPFEMEIENAKN